MSFKIAVIGCGWVSNACHGPAYRKYADEHPDVELSACVDREMNRAQEFRDRFGFKQAFSDYEQMLIAIRPSAVCLNVNVQLNARIGVEILIRGFPLLTEKPPGLSVSEVDLLIETARAANAPNMVAFNRRHAPLLVELMSRMNEVELHHIECQQARVGRLEEDFTTTAIHVIDALQFLAKADFHKVYFRYQDQPGQEGIVTNYSLDGEFTTGVTFHITIQPATGLNIERIMVYGQDHTFLYFGNQGLDSPGSLQHFENGELVMDLDGTELSESHDDYILNGFYAEDVAFFDSLRKGIPIRDDIQSARQSVEIMQFMREHQLVYKRQY